MGNSHDVHSTAQPFGPRLVRLQPRDLGTANATQLNPELIFRLKSIADELKNEFGADLRKAKFPAKVGRLLGRLLSPIRKPPGRPVSSVVSAARELIAQGVPRSQIPQMVIPGFALKTADERTVARERLRRALYMGGKRSVTNRKRVS